MTKDWERYRADIEKHYVCDEKTLEEVKELLEKRRNFTASTRAYRTKLIEWGIRKNVTSRRQTSRLFSTRYAKALPNDDSSQATSSQKPQSSSQSSLVPSNCEHRGDSPLIDRHPSESEGTSPFATSSSSLASLFRSRLQEKLLCKHGFDLPLGAIDAHQLKEMTFNYKNSLIKSYLFQILVAKWQSDGTYLEVALDLLSTTHFAGDIVKLWLQDTDMFKIIDVQVAPSEQRPLLHACFSRIATTRIKTLQSDQHWYKPFLEAVRAKDWNERKEILVEDNFNPAIIGSAFLVHARSYFAEYELKRLETSLVWKIKDLMVPGPVDPKVTQIKEFRSLRARYWQILGDFASTEGDQDIGKKWYKYAVTLDITRIRILEVPSSPGKSPLVSLEQRSPSALHSVQSQADDEAGGRGDPFQQSSIPSMQLEPDIVQSNRESGSLPSFALPGPRSDANLLLSIRHLLPDPQIPQFGHFSVPSERSSLSTELQEAAHHSKRSHRPVSLAQKERSSQQQLLGSANPNVIHPPSMELFWEDHHTCEIDWISVSYPADWDEESTTKVPSSRETGTLVPRVETDQRPPISLAIDDTAILDKIYSSWNANSQKRQPSPR